MNIPGVELRGFFELFSVYCPGSELQLYEASGELVWPDDGAVTTRQLPDLSRWERDIGGLRWHSEDSDELFAWPVTNQQEDITHYLIVRSNTSVGGREGLYEGTAPALDAMAHTLQNQLYLSGELDAMAHELAARYEELNLVYYTDDEVRFLDEGHQALDALVENCNEYLSLDVTTMLMPDLGMCIVQSSQQSPFDAESLVSLLQSNVVELLRNQSRTTVFNDPAETLARFGTACRMIASPVLDGTSSVAGALVIVRSPNAPEFVNSDRNLLIVMSGKASKIIQSSYDNLTGLMRQDGFDRSLASALAHAKQSDKKHTLLHVNVDRMHLINDTIGYHAGDKVLQSVAVELRRNLRDTDRIARLGGDEFGILVHGCSIRQGERVAEKLCHAISNLKIDCSTQVIDTSACIGVAALDKDSSTTISAHAGAEIACSVAKELGRNRWHAYRKDDLSLTERQEQMEWVGRLKHAIRHDEFRLYSQKIVPLAEHAVGHHFEILVRMMDDDGNILLPASFLQVAERYQMMPSLDRWIVKNTLAALSAHTVAMQKQQVTCSINLSGQTLVDRGFAAFVTEQFRKFRVSPSLICFEITETAAIANLEDAKRFMHELKGLGCSFSLDDFGAGLSSFGYLRTLPVDSLKIDGSFVKPIANDETAAAMLEAMNKIGQIVGLSTVAEFAESPAVIERLRQIGVDYAQGHGISRPRPMAEELEEISAAARGESDKPTRTAATV